MSHRRPCDGAAETPRLRIGMPSSMPCGPRSSSSLPARDGDCPPPPFCALPQNEGSEPCLSLTRLSTPAENCASVGGATCSVFRRRRHHSPERQGSESVLPACSGHAASGEASVARRWTDRDRGTMAHLALEYPILGRDAASLLTALGPAGGSRASGSGFDAVGSPSIEHWLHRS